MPTRQFQRLLLRMNRAGVSLYGAYVFAVIVGMTIIGTCTIPIKDLFESEQDGFFAVAVIMPSSRPFCLFILGSVLKSGFALKKINLNLKKFFQLFQKIKRC